MLKTTGWQPTMQRGSSIQKPKVFSTKKEARFSPAWIAFAFPEKSTRRDYGYRLGIEVNCFIWVFPRLELTGASDFAQKKRPLTLALRGRLRYLLTSTHFHQYFNY